MALFDSEKKKKSNELNPKNGNDSENKSQAAGSLLSQYPDYESLTREEAKKLLQKRISEKINSIADIDYEKAFSKAVTAGKVEKELTTEDVDKRMEERRMRRAQTIAMQAITQSQIDAALAEKAAAAKTTEPPVPRWAQDEEKIAKISGQTMDLTRVVEIVREAEKLSRKEALVFAREEKAVAKASAIAEKVASKEEASTERHARAIENYAAKEERDVRKAEKEAAEIAQKQKADIEKLHSRAIKEEEKELSKEQKQAAREARWEAWKKSWEDRLKARGEAKAKRPPSFWVKLIEARDLMFARSDEKAAESERQFELKKLHAIKEEKKRERRHRIEDKTARRIYEDEIALSKLGIIEREQLRARDMAKRREQKIAAAVARRNARNIEMADRERTFVLSVAARENMLRERAEKILDINKQKASFKALPKDERKEKQELLKRQLQTERLAALRIRDQIYVSNQSLPEDQREELPPKNPGDVSDRLRHFIRVNIDKNMMTLTKFKHRLIDKEAVLSNKLVAAVDRIDRRGDQAEDIILSVIASADWHFDRIKIYCDRHKKGLLGAMAGALIISMLAISFYNFVTGYEYAYNGRTLGIVKEQENVTLLVDVVNEQLSKQHDTQISIDKTNDITFKRVFIMGKEIDNQEQVLRRLTYMRDLSAQGFAVYVDDARVSILNSEENAQRALDTVINSFLTTNADTKYESVGFAEVVEIKQVETKLGQIDSVDDTVNKLLTGGRKTATHVVQAGETFADVAETYGISQEQLLASNPDVNMAQLEIGQTLYLTENTPIIRVQTVETKSYTEYLKHTTVYKDDPSNWKGEETVKIKGADGERKVVAKIVRNNGVEAAKMILQEEVISEPVPAVILVGTKPPPPLKGTGTFIYPVSNYKLTSKFGFRWGRMHTGIDMAASVGTKIRASDGGTVTMAGYNGQLGYCIMIDHGGNLSSVYGHCSKLYVSVGEKVYQGQYIADVGNTGRSTGPHLHFEIHYLDEARNPFNYL